MHHIWSAHSKQLSQSTMVIPSIDIQNAFPTLLHSFVCCVLTFINFLAAFGPSTALLVVQLCFYVGHTVIKSPNSVVVTLVRSRRWRSPSKP